MKNFDITETLRIGVEKGSYVIQTRQEFDASAVSGNGVSGKMRMGKWKTRGWYGRLSNVLQAVFDILIQESEADLATAVRDSWLQIQSLERMIGSVEGLTDPVSIEGEGISYQFAIERSSIYSGPGGKKLKSKWSKVITSNDLRQVLVAFVLAKMETEENPIETIQSYMKSLGASLSDLERRCGTILGNIKVSSE